MRSWSVREVSWVLSPATDLADWCIGKSLSPPSRRERWWLNLLGCFAIGVVSGLAESRQLFGPELRTFALIGILGGFTTFSTFGSETFAMIRGEEYLGAAANVGVHVIVSLALVWLGYTIATLR